MSIRGDLSDYDDVTTFPEVASALGAIVLGIDPIRRPKSKPRPQVTYSDIEFMEKYNLPARLNINDEPKFRRLAKLGLIEQDEDYLPWEIYCLTQEGRDLLNSWYKKREPKKRIRNSLKGLVLKLVA